MAGVIATAGGARAALAALYADQFRDNVSVDARRRRTAPGEGAAVQRDPLRVRQAADLFEDIGIYQIGNSVIRIGNLSERVRSAAASASLFSTLGVEPVAARLPSAAEGLCKQMLRKLMYGNSTADKATCAG